MSESMTRREALAALATAAGTLAVTAAARAADAPKPHLTANDPTAMALGYFEDGSKVDANKNPTYKPEQRCNNCLQLTGNAGDAWRACNLFPGKLVNANGWCKVYIKKP
jgi:O-methyltransferase involved in polyketide biosynthesis